MDQREYQEGKILAVNIYNEVKNSFMDYAMSVIVSRALPDVRDGLKPVHRRIMYALYDMGITPDKPHKKSARLVGEVLGKYHPHGDAAVYDALVRLAQDFSTRYPLIDGHGNFGSLDGDPPAAMRYTEARLSRIAMELLTDLRKNTVDFQMNFDDSLEEPEVLPSRFPNLLVNGSTGIAVGMATNIPPHNLGEIVSALSYLLDNPQAETEKLMAFVDAPDFPTGGIILGRKGVSEAYRTGRGVIKVRGKASMEKVKGEKSRIVITEVPYLLNKAKLVERIAELAREKKIEGIADLRDESDRSGVRVVLDIKKDYKPQLILNQLYQFTSLQQTFGINMLALVKGEPKILGLKDILEHYIAHQKDVIVRRSRYELEKAEERAHIVEGLNRALDELDEVITIIRQSEEAGKARTRLMERFQFSEKQAQAILEMRLQKLTGLERKKLAEELQELQERIAYLTSVLQDERLVKEIVKEELQAVQERFADRRRTEIVPDEEDFEYTDLITEEDVTITLTRKGYIKRLPVTTYRNQRRGGRGITSIQTRDKDFVEHMFIASTHHVLLCFSNYGKVYQLKVFEIPESGRQSRGKPLSSILPLQEGEYVAAVIPTLDFDPYCQLYMATARGYIKKTSLQNYRNTHRSGITALKLEAGDELVAVRYSTSRSDVVMGTADGKLIRFDEEDVRSVGRAARGVRGITLSEGDRVIGMEIVGEENDRYLLKVTEKGFGKMVTLKEFRRQRRGGKGRIAIKPSARTGRIVSSRVVQSKGDIIIITAKGLVIREKPQEISILGPYARGVTLIRLEAGDRVVAAAQLQK